MCGLYGATKIPGVRTARIAMRVKLFSLLLLVSTLVVGCATRQPFVYPYPAQAAHAANNGGSVAIQPVIDRRGGPSELDKVLFIPAGAPPHGRKHGGKGTSCGCQ